MPMLPFCASSGCRLKKWRVPRFSLVGRVTPVRAVVAYPRRAEDCPPYQCRAPQQETIDQYAPSFLARKFESTKACDFAMKAGRVLGLNKNLNRKKL